MSPLPKRKRIYGWKKLQDQLIAHLEIPATAKRVACFGKDKKCRADRAKVLAVYIGCPSARAWNAANGKSNEVSGGTSAFAKTRVWYEVGKMIVADMFDPNPNNECSHGINFFRTKAEAERYNPR